MKIYTSYFGNAKALQKDGIVMINIALWPPRWYRGDSIKSVAPTYSILKGTKSDEEYTRRYKDEILHNLNVDYFIKEIESISGGLDVALCCYEKPNEFCHRQLLAEKLREEGYDVQEYEPKGPKQLDLFT